MQNTHGMRQVGKTSGHTIRSHPGATKNDDAFVVGLFEQAEKEFMFLVGCDRVEGVSDSFCGRLAEADFDGDRFLEGPLGESFDFGRDGGGEKESLALFWAQRDDSLHIRKKSHVEHTIHLIEHEMGQVCKLQIPLADKIEEATRGGDEDVDATLNLLPLGSISNAAIN